MQDTNEINDIKRRAGITESDEMNPKYAFQGMNTELLMQFASGKIDLLQYARREMANRGLDQTGKWVGFEQAEQLWK